MPPGMNERRPPFRSRRSFARARYRPVVTPPPPLTSWPLSALLSHLELIRLTRKGGPVAIARAGGGPFLDERERRLLGELNRRQLRLGV